MSFLNLDDFVTKCYWNLSWYCNCTNHSYHSCVFDKKFSKYYSQIVKREPLYNREYLYIKRQQRDRVDHSLVLIGKNLRFSLNL